MSTITPITSSVNCNVTRAGIRVLWAIDCQHIIDLTINNSTRIVTDIELISGATFKRIEFEEDTAFLEQEKTINKTSINVVQLITLYEPGLSNEIRNKLEDLNSVRCMHIIVEDNGGQRWYCGISYFPTLQTWQSEDMRTGDGYANTGADMAVDSAEYLETFVANTFNYALLTEIDPDVVVGEPVMFGVGGVAFAVSGTAFGA